MTLFKTLDNYALAQGNRNARISPTEELQVVGYDINNRAQRLTALYITDEQQSHQHPTHLYEII